jgi:hypothetical protein
VHWIGVDMTDLRQAAQHALDALREFGYHGSSPRWERTSNALRETLARERAMQELSRLGQEIEQEPSQWREMVVVSLVREGIDKHRARELADHFAAQPEPPPEWEAINNIIAEYGLQAISFVSEWKAAQRPWVGLEIEEVQDSYNSDYQAQTRAVEAKLKERNT